MNRAAVLIGVNKVKGRNQSLPMLNDAVRGAQAMRDWALDQGFDQALVKCFVDDNGPVRIAQIQDAVGELLDPMAGVGQLLIYFAGHGINLCGTERWLLSKALDNAAEAVDLETSALHARQGSVPHVVFISDACRTAAAGIAQQNIVGASIFPVPLGSGTAKAVDRFYACALGDPSHEVSVPVGGDARFAFRALYTDALLPLLRGEAPDIVEAVADGLSPAGVIRPWPLQDELEKTFARELAGLKLTTPLSQTPDAIIMSRPGRTWIARVDPDGPVPVFRGTDSVLSARPAAPPPVPTLRGWVDDALGRALGQQAGPTEGDAAGAMLVKPGPEPSPGMSWRTGPPADDALLGRPRGAQPGGGFLGGRVAASGVSPVGAGGLAEVARRHAEEFAPRQFETRCGLKLRGATAMGALGARMGLDWELGGEVLRAHPGDLTSDRVLLTLQDGSGVLVPLLPEFIGELSFGDDGRLVSLAYEASANSPLFDPDDTRRMARRTGRELIVSALARGVFRPAPAVLDALVATAMAGPAPDPVLALLLAYALDDAGLSDRLAELVARMRGAGVPPLYDVAVLAGLAGEASQGCPPGLPLMARGWVGLAARGVILPAPLAALPPLLRPALWTHFSREACAVLAAWLSPPEVHHA